MPFSRFTVSLSEPQHNKLKEIAKEKEVSLVQIVCEACEHYTNNGAGSHQFGAHTETDSKYFPNLEKQLQTKDQQIERLQSALDQSQQFQALTENRYQAEHQQLAEIKGRSFLQRLKAVLVANP
ncbi:MAG: hypothetical protein QF569_28030 [Candidatus Poribacteria bacterium]|nr:hypothetical protein [Candidatus Poribacteria bacterium]